jgi:phytoene dehydrogenase-like protein
MSDSNSGPEYEVIVIGAGAAGGLPVGAYLQKAGACMGRAK